MVLQVFASCDKNTANDTQLIGRAIGNDEKNPSDDELRKYFNGFIKSNVGTILNTHTRAIIIIT